MTRKKCILCGKPLPPVAIRHGDPYCSATCARKGYGSEEETKS